MDDRHDTSGGDPSGLASPTVGVAAGGAPVLASALDSRAYELLGRALAGSPDRAVALVERGGVLRFVNAAAARLLDSVPEQLAGRPLAELLGAERADVMVRSIEHVLATGQSVQGVDEVRLPGGPVWLDSTVAPFRDGPGASSVALVIAKDVSARMRAEELHRAILQTAVIGVWLVEVVDGVSRLVEVNDTYCAMSGYGRDELVGQPASLLDGGDTPTPIPAPQAWSCAGCARFEARHRRRDGSRFEVEVSVQPLGRTGRTVHFIHDASEHRRAVRELQASNHEIEVARRYWQQTFDSMGDAVTIHDAGFRIRHANRAALTLLAGDEASVLGRHCHELFHGLADGPVSGCPGREVLAAGQCHSFRLHEPHLGRWLDVTCAPLRDAQGKPELVHVVRDVTEKRRLEQQFQAAQRMEAVARLTAGVAHDFNNLLGVILGAASTEAETAEERSEASLAILHAGRRAAELTRQLLAFSRQQVFRMDRLDVRDVVRDVARLLVHVVGASVAVEVAVADESCVVLGDRAQLEQVLMNLALNARDAMPAGGRLVLSARRGHVPPGRCAELPERLAGQVVVLTVVDTGTGMDAETLALAFEPFFTTKEPGRGTGLGLAAVHGIVHQHEGLVSAESEPGRGTCFTIFLPLAPEGVSVSKPAPRTARPPQPARLRVLAVEDEPDLRRLVERILARAGWEPTVAADGAAALARARSAAEPFHVLVTDLRLPDMTGLDLAERLLAVQPDLRVVLTTGFTDAAPDWSRLGDAPTCFLAKPWTAQELVEAITKTAADDTAPVSSTPRV
ncbi:MAG: PAS domain-containing protein [Myxococcales bacterium]|nr:PAS domain-containing protein [Myxococcales bacterium]